MPFSFICRNENCSQESHLCRIEREDDEYYVVCEHCSSKNEVTTVPYTGSSTLKLEVIGLLND